MAGPAVQLDSWDEPQPASEVTADERLAELAGAIGPLRRVMAAVATRLVETRSYERLCYARLSDYARERPGISARQMQDLARVHRAMLAMPALEAALLSNQLPWSKLRLVARVATAADAWVERARRVTTRQLEQIAREALRRRDLRARPRGARAAGRDALRAGRAREVEPRARDGRAGGGPAPVRRTDAGARRSGGLLGDLRRAGDGANAGASRSGATEVVSSPGSTRPPRNACRRRISRLPWPRSPRGSRLPTPSSSTGACASR